MVLCSTSDSATGRGPWQWSARSVAIARGSSSRGVSNNRRHISRPDRAGCERTPYRAGDGGYGAGPGVRRTRPFRRLDGGMAVDAAGGDRRAFVVVGWINGGDPYRLQFPNMENIQPTAETQAASPPVPAASAALAAPGVLQLRFNLPYFDAVLERPLPETADMLKTEEKYKQELVDLEKKKQAAKGKDADIGKAIGQVCHEAAAKLKGWGRYANAVTLYLAAFNSAGDPVDRVESDLAQLSSSFAYYKAAMRIIYGRTLSDDLALKIVPILANLDTVAEDIRKLEAASPPDSASEKLGPLIAACRGAWPRVVLRGGYYVFLKDQVKAKADVERA